MTQVTYFENLLPESDHRKAFEDKHHATSVFGQLAYGLMCTAVYPGLSNDFAFKVGNTRKPGEVDTEQLTAPP